MPLFVLNPPAQYVHHFNGPVIERVLPLAEARRVCAGTVKGACHLIIPRDGPVRDRGAYRRHELAHCNGWNHQHHAVASERSPPDW
jgi:hypothetical protein